jgi:hypothetical protein
MKYVIIQPGTYEDVLASVCYMVYWNDTALLRTGAEVDFHEDATYRHACDVIDQTPQGDTILIDISSPPQIECALALWRTYRNFKTIMFVGYQPYSKLLGLPFFHLQTVGSDLIDGAHNYVYNIQARYKHAHATLDGHINVPGDDRQFMPAFFGVGCKRGCSYCYVRTDAGYPYGFIDLDEGKRLLDYMIDQGWNVHFEDENFFLHPGAEDFVRHLRGRNTKWICITDSLLLNRTVKRMGVDEMLECGHWLSEIGLESADPRVLKKKQHLTNLLAVQNRDPSNVQDGTLNLFWLAVTYLPDETISSLNRNGRFYAAHGMTHDRLHGRLKTQSSLGGCGQFFLPYPGTPYWPRVQAEGKRVASPALRLRPSWIGNAMLADVPEAARAPTDEEFDHWLSLYTGDRTLPQRLLDRCDGVATVEQVTELDADALATFGSMAKLRLITPVGGERLEPGEAEAML